MQVKTIETNQNAQKPTGSKFIIDQCDFRFGKNIDCSMVDLEEDKILDWPMIYVLANDKFAYVGQTTSVKNRINQHSANIERKDFKKCNIIFNEEFNTSVITDYEHRLIGLMNADQKYKLTNKNEGMTRSNYFSKEVYETMFNELWEELMHLDLANHTIDEIEESEVFKYSPFKSLTADQRVALDNIMHTIEDGLDKAEPICVQGMPGTGKTILAIYLIKMLRDNEKYKDKKIALIEPVSSLRNTLKASLKGIRNIRSSDIISPSQVTKYTDGYDILLVDEAHKLKRRKNLSGPGEYSAFSRKNLQLGLDEYEGTQLDWILKKSKLPILFYDAQQSIGPNCITRKQFKEKIGPYLVNSLSLDTQMRVEGGENYLKLINDLLNCQVSGKYNIKNYDFKIHDSFNDFYKSFNKTYEAHNLSRMIAGYAWPWISDIRKCKDNRENLWDIEIDDIKLRWNITNDNWVGKGFNNEEIAHEVGCIHSIQGYDLSYSYVIIGKDIYYDSEKNKIKSDKSFYYDQKGKNTATQDDLDQYIKNIYYVLMTRGIKGTHLFICDEKLRNYFKQFINNIE